MAANGVRQRRSPRCTLPGHSKNAAHRNRFMNEQHAPPESPPADSGATHRNRLWRVGVVADTIAVAAGLYSFLDSDVLLTVLTIVAFLFVGSSWFWRRRTGPAVALLVVGCLILGAGGAMKIRDLIHSGSTPAVLPAPIPPTTRTSTGSTPPQTQAMDPGGTTGSPDSDQPRKLVDQTITLPAPRRRGRGSVAARRDTGQRRWRHRRLRPVPRRGRKPIRFRSSRKCTQRLLFSGRHRAGQTLLQLPGGFRLATFSSPGRRRIFLFPLFENAHRVRIHSPPQRGQRGRPARHDLGRPVTGRPSGGAARRSRAAAARGDYRA